MNLIHVRLFLFVVFLTMPGIVKYNESTKAIRKINSCLQKTPVRESKLIFLGRPNLSGFRKELGLFYYCLHCSVKACSGVPRRFKKEFN